MAIATTHFQSICKRAGIPPEIVPSFADQFVEPGPPYQVEIDREPVGPFEPDHMWIRANKNPANYRHVAAHLAHRISLATFARWYPQAAWWDLDDMPRSRAEEIRARHGFTTSNSILGATRSPESWALVYKPVYNNRPMTARLFETIGCKMADLEGVEMFPRVRERAGRVPFGKHFTPVDEVYREMQLVDLLSAFERLDEYEMKYRVPFDDQSVQGSLMGPRELTGSGWYREGRALYFHGLEPPYHRHDAQARVIYYLLRCNMSPEHVADLTYRWIKAKHNGHSRDLNAGHYQTIRGEIGRQTRSLADGFTGTNYWPDWVHHTHNGWITREDLHKIAHICGGNRPRMRFTFELLRFANARQRRPWVRVHRDHFRQWAGNRTYTKYLKELEDKGILRRNSSYWAAGDRTGMSKSITFHGWTFSSLRDAILDDERAPETYEETIRQVYEPQEYRQMIMAAGASKQTAYSAIRDVFKAQK